MLNQSSLVSENQPAVDIQWKLISFSYLAPQCFILLLITLIVSDMPVNAAVIQFLCHWKQKLLRAALLT